jgi:hypothetical protein
MLERSSHTSNLEELPLKIYRRSFRVVDVGGPNPVPANGWSLYVFCQLHVGDFRSHRWCLHHRAKPERPVDPPTACTRISFRNFVDPGDGVALLRDFLHD